jgi:hypothetical protein
MKPAVIIDFISGLEAAFHIFIYRIDLFKIGTTGFLHADLSNFP